MANSALGQTGFGADAIATSNVQNSAITAAKIADDTITEAKLAAGATLQLGTMQASTSGTSIDFTGIPAGTKEIVVMLNGVSTNGAGILGMRIGDSGGVESSGYVSHSTSMSNAAAVAGTTSTTMFNSNSGSAANTVTGVYTLHLMNAATFLWLATWSLDMDASGTRYQSSGTGVKSLSAELDRVSILTSAGDTFDAGSVNIAYK